MNTQREQSLKEYYKNPETCLNCNKIIEVKDNEKISDVKDRKFCGSSCSTTHSNKLKPKRIAKPSKLCLNCEKPLSNNIKKYCNVICQHDYEYKLYIKKWKEGENSGFNDGDWGKVSKHIRRYLFEKYDNKCSKCGWGEINPYNGSIPLEVDHMDGNYKNNKEENLNLICPNCHSLTKTYRGGNIGNGRPITWRKRDI